ncbi:MAG: carboxypeptidase regulatory-like domain-containing protein [Archangiaceae bacterium]|nr:carboxypeptidase regulatory-like domain-containing protein [Archangiaceae bacterium]
MKRALVTLSLLLLGAVLWWALHSRAVTPGLGPVELGGAAHEPAGTASVDAPSTLATGDAGAPLAPLPALRGEVRDDTGGVAQAAVELNRRGPPGDSDCESAARTTSVAGGSFEAGPLCPGQYDVRASRNARVATAVVRLARGAPAEPLVLTLRDGTRLTVRVRDEKKAPIAGAEVHAQDAQSGYQADGVTDAKGVATFEGLTPRKHSVWASAPDHLDASLYGRTLAAGEDEVQLTLQTGAHFEGRVVGPDGEAIEGAMVQLGTRRLSARSWDTVGSGLSRDGGAFSVPPVRPGSYTAVTTHDDWVGSEQAVRVPGPRVTLKLSRGASVDGLFLDAHGVPMAEGDINATQLPQGASRNPHLDGWGRFKLEGLARGEWTVIGVAKSQDGGPQGVAVAQLTVKNEQPQTLTLQLLEGVPISGRCVDSKGAPADTDVIAIEQALYRRLRIGGLGSAAQLPPGAVAISACTGRFELTGLKPGRYALLACGNDDDPLLANAGDVDLTLTCQVGELRFGWSTRPAARSSATRSATPRPSPFPTGASRDPCPESSKRC